MWWMVLIEEENIGGNKLQKVGVKIHGKTHGCTRGVMGRVPVRRPPPAGGGGHGALRDNMMMLFIGTWLSNLCTAVHTPAKEK